MNYYFVPCGALCGIFVGLLHCVTFFSSRNMNAISSGHFTLVSCEVFRKAVAAQWQKLKGCKEKRATKTAKLPPVTVTVLELDYLIFVK